MHRKSEMLESIKVCQEKSLAGVNLGKAASRRSDPPDNQRAKLAKWEMKMEKEKKVL